MTTLSAHGLQVLKGLDISVRPEQILRQHYPDIALAGPEVRAAAATMAAHALQLAAPTAWLRQVGLRLIDDVRVEIASGVTVTSVTLSRSLCDAVSAQLFVVTLGPQLDARVTQLFQAMDGLEGLLLDTAGWILVQSALGGLRRRLAAQAEAGGHRVTRRLGPGYADWSVTDQASLVSALSEGQTLPGIEVLESGAILPEKTLTGLYGLVPLQSLKKE